MPQISKTHLDVHPLCLGGNVFGWTADEPQSFSVLDAYAEQGGNFIDTADMYADGQSETIIGKWMKSRGNRDRVVLATKVGKRSGLEGLGAQTITQACEASLKRLQTDFIDLYYAHEDDTSTPMEESLQAFENLVQQGKVRHIAASNFTADRLDLAMKTADSEGVSRYAALQPHYNLMERNEYEASLADSVRRNDLSCIPYFSLAMGFLTGKYRPDAQLPESVRSGGAAAYLNERGVRVLKALDSVAADTSSTVPAVALAWLAAQPNVVAPIASARTTEQLGSLMPMADLQLSADQVKYLTQVSSSGTSG